MIEYTIQPNDDISKLVRRFAVSRTAVLAANTELHDQEFRPGTKIQIPVNRYLYQKYPWYIHDPYRFLSRTL